MPSRKEKQDLAKETESLKVSLSQLKKQLTALQEEGTLGIFQAQLKAKEEEVQKLEYYPFFLSEESYGTGRGWFMFRKEAAKKVGEIEDKLNKN